MRVRDLKIVGKLGNIATVLGRELLFIKCSGSRWVMDREIIKAEKGMN